MRQFVLKLNLPNFKDDSILDNGISLRSCQNDCNGALIFATATCTLSALAIAASDGPAPFMDVVAVSVWSSCNASAVYSHRACMRGC